MSTPVVTKWRRFVGMNIKGTPAMPAEDVQHDLEVAKTKGSVIVTQEFRWPWYWKTLSRILPTTSKAKWRSAPGGLRGFAKPVFAAQAVIWRAKVWKRRATKVQLLHAGVAGISENRYLRAVLLEDRETKLSCWFGTTHNVVGGDEEGDPLRRRLILKQDTMMLDKFLTELGATEHPIVFQLDANIHPHTPGYRDFMAVMRKHKAVLHGTRGVEYLFTVNGKTTNVRVREDWVVPTSELRTDHEGRGITFRLEGSTA